MEGGGEAEGVFNIYTIIIGSWGILGVDIFIIISSYFLISRKFDIRRVLNILVQTSMYIIFFYNVCFLYDMYKYKDGIIVLKKLISGTIEALSQPLFCECYWFITAYVLFLLVIPALNKIIKILNQGSLRYLIIVSLIGAVLSYKSQNIIADTYFFSVIYLCVAYIKTYGSVTIDRLSNYFKIISLIALVILSKIIMSVQTDSFAIKFIQGILAFTIGNIGRYSVMILFIALLVFYKTIKMRSIYNRVINTISSLTLGVYLFHENALLDCPNVLRSIFKILVNYNFFGENIFLFPFKYIFIVIIVFLCGCIIEYFRKRILHKPIMEFIEKTKRKQIDMFNEKVENIFK